MPYIKLSGIDKERVFKARQDLINIVVKITGTEKEKIRIYYNPMEEIVDGKIFKKRLSVEIDWMPRPKEMCDEVAKEFIQYFEDDEFEIIKIYFNELLKDKHYIKRN